MQVKIISYNPSLPIEGKPIATVPAAMRRIAIRTASTASYLQTVKVSVS